MNKISQYRYNVLLNNLSLSLFFFFSFFSQVAVETIYVAIQTFVYSLLLYSMIGFDWQADKFLWFYYYVFMCFVYFTLYGMMLVALTPSYQIAAIVMSFFLSFWNLFSGFLIPRMVNIITLLTIRLHFFPKLANICNRQPATTLLYPKNKMTLF